MRELVLYLRLARINVARDRHLERIARARQSLSEHLMVDPSQMSRLRTFVERHEARMERILKRVGDSDEHGDASEAKANDVINRFEAYQATVDDQIGAIDAFTNDLERSLGNAPRSAPSSQGAANGSDKGPSVNMPESGDGGGAAPSPLGPSPLALKA